MLRYALPVAMLFLSNQVLAAPFPSSLLYPSFHAASARATLETFDVGHSKQTEPAAIDNAGDIAGSFQEPANANAYDGFIRRSNGKTVKFKAPDASLTLVIGINNSGVVAGTGIEAGDVCEGFFRAANGTMTTFALPATEGLVSALNDEGDVAGEYQPPSDFHERTFIRTANGTIIKFRIGTAGTFPTFIANDGTVLGNYRFANSGGLGGFIRTPDGTIIKLRIGKEATYPLSINASGVIVGWYEDGGLQTFAFERTPDGTITKFLLPHSTSIKVQSINDLGTIAGSYDTGSTTGGFIRTSDGTVTKVKYGALAINAGGTIIGFYTNEEEKMRGFVRVPTN